MSIFSIALVVSGLSLAAPLILAAIGGLLSERSGVINIGLEGMMLGAAFAAVAATSWTGQPYVGLLAGMAAGALLGWIHAFFSVTLRADQIISATAINLLAVGVTATLIVPVWGQPGHSAPIPRLGKTPIPLLKDLPGIGPLFDLNFLAYISLALPFVIAYVLFRTPWGLRLRASGESPTSALSVGVDVIRVRYISVTLSGLLAGLGGVYLTLVQVGVFQRGMTAGRGFIALAALIFGKWRPFPVLGAALLFGFADAFQFRAQVESVGVPHELLIALPNLLALVALSTFVGRASAPAAIGQPLPVE